MVLICPSMLSADPTRLGDELQAVERAGANCIHWDIMDGCFVDTITFGAQVVAAHRKISSLRFDVHLMVENPDKHLQKFAEAGADSIIVHSETTKHLHRTLGNIKKMGKLSGVALNPATSIDCLKYCLDIIDIVIVMSVNPGSSGQQFIQSQLEKIAELKQIIPETTEICVDGGINANTGRECIINGANSLVTGSYLFKSKDYAKAIQELRTC
ncbi:MAG: ribulose-phosphate 3-epimerase [Alphaproteobacteria bacterium]|nr:ribulose-phosphate 3-epimerase [Alphaproteobacteria bacterium]